MKHILHDVLKESKFSVSNLKKHIDPRHIKMYQRDPRFKDLNFNNDLESFAVRYDAIADEISRKKVGKSDDTSSRYVGFITKEGRYIKYDTKFKDFVAYDSKYTITMHKKSRKAYDKIRDRDFFKEMPYNETKTA